MPADQPVQRRPVLAMGEILVDFIVADGATSLDAAANYAARAGGAPANAAVALARLGLPSAFCGVAGDDPFGARVRRELAAEGVDTSRLRQTSESATTLAFAWRDDRGDGHFWLLRGADAKLDPDDASRAAVGRLQTLIVGSVSLSAQPSRSAIERATQLAVQAAVPVVFDINLRPSLWADARDARAPCEAIAQMSTIVKLSLDDAIGLWGSDVGPQTAIAHVLGLGPVSVVLTDGERGSWFASRHRPAVTHIPALAVDAIEPTGAGDAFTAALVARAIAVGWAPVTAADVTYASAAGALATTMRGAWDGLPTPDQLDALLTDTGTVGPHRPGV